MRYGAMNSPLRPVMDEIREIARLGFDVFELTMDAPRAHYGLIEREREDISRVLKECGLGLVCHLPTFVYTADLTEGIREASLRETLESLRVAGDLQALKVVLHPSIIGGLGTLVMEKSRGYALESLESIVREADRRGIVLCLENLMPRSRALVEPEDFEAPFRMFPSLKMTLDTGHSHLGQGGIRRTLAFIERFGERIGHIHMSDNFGREDDHLPIGAGIIDYPEIVKAIKTTGYDDTLTLEVFSRDRDYLKISREKLAKLFETL
ncbi:MAG: sugar phosphate isomerase/epimerase [Deltaproteobacteria bacterium]|nr:sugar phosphate isomerase/epimerase [Deltaproteobacteria bacterium]